MVRDGNGWEGMGRDSKGWDVMVLSPIFFRNGNIRLFLRVLLQRPRYSESNLNAVIAHAHSWPIRPQDVTSTAEMM